MYKRDRWRLIKSSPASGAWNMALDEAILESVAAQKSPSTLRLYAWQPACLSLGYAQPFRDVDLRSLLEHGWEVVRRPTGGRAILHTDELTYSITAPQNEPRVAGTILESYRRLSTALVKALQLLGLPAEAEQEYPLPSGSQVNGAVCFEVPSNYEITVAGKKLIGSAQARRHKSVLQHGSLPLCGDLARITWALSFDNEADRKQAARRLLEHATTVETVTGYPITWEQAAASIEHAFSTVLDLELFLDEPTPAEIECAETLFVEKYAHPTWSERI
ncbi:MAG: lipoate--protein ligase family protein [Chloroflexota bacterium]|jgi:lipoate-protein ligase A